MINMDSKMENKPKMAYSRDAFTRDYSERQERNKREKREKERHRAIILTQAIEIANKSYREQERNGAMPDGLTQAKETASNRQRELERARGSQRELERELQRARKRAIESQIELDRARQSQIELDSARQSYREEIWSYLDIMVTN